MSFSLIKYIGDATKRILTTQDLTDLGATGDQIKSLSGNSVLTFVRGVAHDVETGVAEFIAHHPDLAGEFHLLSQDEAADEPTAVNPLTEGAAAGSTAPAGTTPPETVPTVEAGPAAEKTPPTA